MTNYPLSKASLVEMCGLILWDIQQVARARAANELSFAAYKDRVRALAYRPEIPLAAAAWLYTTVLLYPDGFRELRSLQECEQAADRFFIQLTKLYVWLAQ